LLEVWPTVPLFIRDVHGIDEGLDNILEFLEHGDHVERVELFNLDSLTMDDLLEVMQRPFPELTVLSLQTRGSHGSVFSDSFLGESSPRLRYLDLCGISLEGLPKLLLSAPSLVDLHLLNIPLSGYISPETTVTALSTLTSLESLWLRFRSPLSRPDWASEHPPPLTHAVLPVLTYFRFSGTCEYLDDFVARIDTPELEYLDITFLNRNHFNAPQFIQFITRTPAFEALDKAHFVFEDAATGVKLKSHFREFKIKIPIHCEDFFLQLASLGKLCTSCLPSLSTLEDLYIYSNLNININSQTDGPDWQDKVEDDFACSLLARLQVWHWLEFLEPFAAVSNLYMCKLVAKLIAPALQDPSLNRGTEVLPTLQNIFLEGDGDGVRLRRVEKGIKRFLAARERSGNPVDNFYWDRYRRGPWCFDSDDDDE
jgi:hypothetical protein